MFQSLLPKSLPMRRPRVLAPMDMSSLPGGYLSRWYTDQAHTAGSTGYEHRTAPTTHTHVPANKKGDCVAIGMLNADACLINDMLDVAVSPRGDTDATAGATLGSKEVATSKASNSGLNHGTRL